MIVSILPEYYLQLRENDFSTTVRHQNHLGSFLKSGSPSQPQKFESLELGHKHLVFFFFNSSSNLNRQPRLRNTDLE